MSIAPSTSVDENFAVNTQEVYIGGPHHWMSLDLASIWHYREVLYHMVWRDIKVRYKQTLLGAAWAIIQPLSTMMVFTLFFGQMENMTSDGLPYSVFCFAGVLPWTFTVNGLTMASNSLVTNANLITKVYFPRILVPMTSVISGLVDFALGLVVLLLLLAYHGYYPGLSLLWLIVPTFLAFWVALGAGLWLSALNVKYRDVRYTVPFLTQLWMFASPIFYPRTIVAEKWQFLYQLNPMTGITEGFRWAVVGGGLSGRALLSSCLVTAFLVVTGAIYFRMTERRFADIV